MAGDPCCNNAGGRVRITANGKVWKARSSVTITPVNYERAGGSNQDGSMYVTTKPMPYEGDVTLSDGCGARIEDVMGCPLDVTIECIDIRRIYYFTNAVVVGRPQINTETGEIRGLKINSDQLRYDNI